MEKNKERIIRIYEVDEMIQDFDELQDGDLKKEESNTLILKEYIQLDKNKMATGRSFSLTNLIKKLEDERAIGNIMDFVALYNNKTDSFIYKLVVNDGNLKPDSNSNVVTNQRVIVISKYISQKYLMDSQLKELDETLVQIKECVKRRAKRYENYKLQRKNNFKRAICVTAAVAGVTVAVAGVKAGLPTKFYNYLQEQHAIKVQEEMDRLKQLGPTHSELQQLDDYHELDPWSSYMDQKREEHEKSKKLP